ncbi:MAG: hypothetical protein ABTQ32_20915 [Myxococcaceae bacterium]
MTENDWLLLSEWVDGTLTAEARAAFELRLGSEPALAEAARRLQTLDAVAKHATPTEADRSAWAPRRASWPFGVLALVLLAGTALLGRGSCGEPVRTSIDAGVAMAVRTVTTLELDRLDPRFEREPAPIADGGPRNPVELAITVEPPAGPPHGTRGPVRGATPMPLRADASVAIAVSTLLFAVGPAQADAGHRDAGAAVVDAGAPDGGVRRPTLRLRRGDLYVMRSFVASMRPGGVVQSTPTGTVTQLEAVAVGSTVLTLDRDGDGGVSELDVVVVDEVSQPHTVTLGVRELKRLLVPGRVRWSVGDRELVEVVEREPFLELKGKHAGATTLEAWFSDGEHRTWPVIVRVPTDDVQLEVGRQKVLSITRGSKWSVVPPELVKAKELGSSLVLMGEVAGRGTLEFVDASGTSKSVAMQVSGSDVTRTPPSRTLKWAEAGPVLRIKRGEVVALDPEAPFRSMHAQALNARKKAGLVVVTSEQTVEGSIDIELTDGTIQRLIVVVDP